MNKARIFDGKKFAKENESKLKRKVDALRRVGIVPKLVAISVGESIGSRLYISLKKKAAERIGVNFEVLELDENEEAHKLIELIGDLNQDKTVDGIMVQLPLPEKFSAEERDRIINLIDKKKDVDGLADGSQYQAATVKAVIKVIDAAAKIVRPLFKVQPLKVVVVGSQGFVGKKLTRSLRNLGYSVDGVDQGSNKGLRTKTVSADILISATGVPNLIKEDMVKEGAVVIDVGSPKGDVDPSVALKASFITPVPGGVGPVTVVSLLENLVEAASK